MSLKSYDRDNDYQVQSECKSTSLYCVASIMLLLVSVIINTPGFTEIIPGGLITVGLVSVIVFVAVMVLCFKQAPRV